MNNSQKFKSRSKRWVCKINYSFFNKFIHWCFYSISIASSAVKFKLSRLINLRWICLKL